jgi:hypothetical protein
MNNSPDFPFHYSSTVCLKVNASEAFAFLDDPRNLSSHMEKSSLMMAGSKMSLELDSKNGKEIGSKIIMQGKMMGVPLYVNEDVTERVPPFKKSWETRGPQQLVVIDQYKMGFELKANEKTSDLRVFIDYSLPQSGFSKTLGKLFGKVYAKWCTEKMANDAARHFAQ